MGNTKPLNVREACVNTHTGSVEVAAPQSNTVKQGAVPVVGRKIKPSEGRGVVGNTKPLNVSMVTYIEAGKIHIKDDQEVDEIQGGKRL